MKPVAPQQNEGMPYEVATAMLSERRARITNSFRKQCQLARERVYVSSAPIRRMPAQDTAGEIVKGWGYTECVAISPEQKTVRRFQSASLVQLGNWLRRAMARRAIIQKRYLAITDETPHAEFARAALSVIANRLDIIRDCAEDEINGRVRNTHSASGGNTFVGLSESIPYHWRF